MNLNHLLGQGRIRRDIIAHVLIFLTFFQFHEVDFMDLSLHCNLSYKATQRGMGRGGGMDWNTILYILKLKSYLLVTPQKTVFFFPLSIWKPALILLNYTQREKYPLSYTGMKSSLFLDLCCSLISPIIYTNHPCSFPPAHITHK